jgi:uncharacterized protein YmfQ (DUF2313 family)
MNHADVLKLLFPLKDLGGVFNDDIAIEGKHLDALKTSADNLLLEAFPDTATLTLSDWERNYQIIVPAGVSIAQRQRAVVQRRRMRGGLSRRYFVALAAAVGYTITIEEIPSNGLGGGATDKYVWRIHVGLAEMPTTTEFTAGDSGAGELLTDWDQLGKTTSFFTAGDSGAGELLTDWPDDRNLEELFNNLKPAHTRIIFVYENV